MKDLLSILDNFSLKRVLVVGDIMLDHYLEGTPTRMSPEAPIPIFLIEREWFAPGGAGNTAVNLKEFNSNVGVVGKVGNDHEGRIVLSHFTNKFVRARTWISRRTIEKIRGLDKGQHVARFDREIISGFDEKTENEVVCFLKESIGDNDLVLVSDYEKGFITEKIARELVQISKEKGKMLIVDTKPKHFKWFRGCFCVKPNKIEAEEFSGIKIDCLEDAEKAGNIIKQQLETNVLLTLGSMGMVLFEEERTTRFTSRAEDVFDVTGAGDTVLAVFSLALSAGASMRQAADLANHAAAIVIAKPGTATVSLEELKKSIS